MKVQGIDRDIAADEYAREVAEYVAVYVEHAVACLPETATALNPEAVAQSFVDLIACLADDSHNELARLLGPFWSTTHTWKMLGLNSKQALFSRRDSGSVLGFKTSDGDVVWPVSQFQRRGGKVEVKPALVPFFRALRGFDPWSVGVLLHTPAPELDGLAPLDWARDDRSPKDLLHLAQAVAREWSAGSIPQAAGAA